MTPGNPDDNLDVSPDVLLENCRGIDDNMDKLARINELRRYVRGDIEAFIVSMAWADAKLGEVAGSGLSLSPIDLWEIERLRSCLCRYRETLGSWLADGRE